ncbi:hypothetical protein BJX63DRAFT_432509 [Aspergillus granulosus]|uniref:BZIP domain-containing protein n=1 Tax=Aspergillus granulosus TaxID=176169 RepID=A0ABR4HAX7_9EURO
MDMLEQYPSWAQHDARSLHFPLPCTTPTEADDFSLNLVYGLESPGTYQTRQIPSLSLDINPEIPDRAKSSSPSPTSAKSLSPINTSSPTLSGGHGLVSPVSKANPEEIAPKAGQKNTKRAVQNRAAQRRFRERRDEQNRSLRERAEYLQEQYEALGEKLNQKADEISQLEKENQGLQTEIEDLRRRWRTMVLLLQRPKSMQFLSMFVGETGLPVDDLDGYVRCLDALIFTDKT